GQERGLAERREVDGEQRVAGGAGGADQARDAAERGGRAAPRIDQQGQTIVDARALALGRRRNRRWRCSGQIVVDAAVKAGAVRLLDAALGKAALAWR